MPQNAGLIRTQPCLTSGTGMVSTRTSFAAWKRTAFIVEVMLKECSIRVQATSDRITDDEDEVVTNFEAVVLRGVAYVLVVPQLMGVAT